MGRQKTKIHLSHILARASRFGEERTEKKRKKRKKKEKEKEIKKVCFCLGIKCILDS